MTLTIGSPFSNKPTGEVYEMSARGAVTAGLKVGRRLATQNGHFYPNFPGCYASSDTAPTSNQILSVLQNGTQVGTLTQASGALTASFSSSGTVSISPGDVIELTTASGSNDATWADFSTSIRASV